MPKNTSRRNFLKQAVTAGLASSVIPLESLGGFSMQTYAADNPMLGGLQTLAKAAAATDRVLVLIQLKGGNDGLNTLVPFTSQEYYNARPQYLAEPANQVSQLSDTMGLSQNAAALQPLWDGGKLSFIQQVGYDTPNRSHFRGTDIWLTGSDSEEVLHTGWMARYMETRYPDYGTTPPIDPAAIHIDPVLSLALKGSSGGFGIAMQSPDTFYNLVQAGNQFIDETAPQTPGGTELSFVRRVNTDSIAYSQRVKEAADLADNQVTYGTSSLEQQLAIVARLIGGGLQTPVYIVKQTGYDTHSNQDTRHPALIQTLTQAIASFQEDIEKLGVADRVIGMTFSEFGRRLAENGSKGTDHGTSSVQIAFGNKVQPGIIGADPDFTTLDSRGDSLFNIEYRQLYASILSEWFGATPEQMATVFPTTWESVGLIATPTSIGDLQDKATLPEDFRLEQNYPNPFNAGTRINYSVPRNGHVEVTIFDQLGRKIRTLTDRRFDTGTYQLHWDGRDAHGRIVASGQYFYVLRAEGAHRTRSMTMVK
jgi:uncharacterized protein (DUF1501 family)